MLSRYADSTKPLQGQFYLSFHLNTPRAALPVLALPQCLIRTSRRFTLFTSHRCNSCSPSLDVQEQHEHVGYVADTCRQDAGAGEVPHPARSGAVNVRLRAQHPVQRDEVVLRGRQRGTHAAGALVHTHAAPHPRSRRAPPGQQLATSSPRWRADRTNCIREIVAYSSYYPGMYMEGLRKTQRDSNQESQIPS